MEVGVVELLEAEVFRSDLKMLLLVVSAVAVAVVAN